MEQSPQRYAGHNCYNCALLSFFFCFFNYLLSVYRKTAHNRAMDDRNSPHKGTLGTIVMIMPYIFFFFLFKYLLFIYRKTVHVQAHDDVEPSPQRYARHDHNDCALFSFLYLNTHSFYRKTAHVWAHNDMELSPPRYAGHDRYDHALFLYFLFFFSRTYCFFTGKLPIFGLAMTWNCPHQGTLA